MGQMQNPDHKDALSLFRCAGALRALHGPEINTLVFQRTVEVGLFFYIGLAVLETS